MDPKHRSLRWRFLVPLVGLLTLALFILGCGEDAAAPAPTATKAPVAPAATPTPAPTATATPKPQPVESRLKVAFTPPDVQTTMQIAAVSSGGGLLRSMYDHLIFNNRFDKSLEPMLAESWSMDPNGKDWTFKLREGVPFHNGGEFTTKDVVGTYQIVMVDGADQRSGVPQQLYDKMGGVPDMSYIGIDNIEVIDDYNFAFHMVEPWPSLGYAVSEEIQYMHYSWDHWENVGGIDGYMEDPVGTGPFKFVELKLNQHQLFERFKQPGDDHWWKIPDFAEVQFFYVSESATRLAMLLTGEAHISSLTTDLLLEAEAQGMSRVQSTVPGFSVFFWFLGTYYPGDPGHDPANPLLDARVRGAVNHGIDRVALKEALFPGERAQYNTVNFFENFRQHFKHDKWVPYAHDPEKSKQLLAEAGYSDGLEIEMWAPASRPGLPEAGDMAEIMATDLNNAGFDVKLNVTEVVRVYEVVKSHEKSYGGTPKIALMRYSAKPVFIHWPNSSRRNLPKGGGWTSYQDEFIEGIRTTYNNTVDPQKRLDIELQYGDHHYDEYGTVPLFWILPEAGINPNVVAEYKVDHSNFGPVRGMEWVKAVFN